MNRLTSVAFFTIRLKADFEALEEGRSEDKTLYKDIRSVIDSLKSDPAAGTRIPERIWPKFYKKRYPLTNLWKYDLPSGWRLTYTIKTEEEKIICMILEWMTHTEYNRRFRYQDS